MAETLLFELVSPHRLVISEPVEMVVVPGASGYFGALPRHTPLMSGVLPGVIDVYKEGRVADRIFVTGGFAEANETGCTVLAEEAIPVTELTDAMASERLDLARKAVEDATDAVTREAGERAVRVAEAMRAALSL